MAKRVASSSVTVPDEDEDPQEEIRVSRKTVQKRAKRAKLAEERSRIAKSEVNELRRETKDLKKLIKIAESKNAEERANDKKMMLKLRAMVKLQADTLAGQELVRQKEHDELKKVRKLAEEAAGEKEQQGERTALGSLSNSQLPPPGVRVEPPQPFFGEESFGAENGPAAHCFGGQNPNMVAYAQRSMQQSRMEAMVRRQRMDSDLSMERQNPLMGMLMWR